MAALLVGGIVAVASISWQNSLSGEAAKQATRLENLRFVRQLSSEPGTVARPFSGFDLQDQILGNLDLRGADLTEANLQHANLGGPDLSPITAPGPGGVLIPRQPSSLYGANLTGANLNNANLTNVTLNKANLTGAELYGAHMDRATLFGANLTGIKYSTDTRWPYGFKPPPPPA